jgi:hypothetical protein
MSEKQEQEQEKEASKKLKLSIKGWIDLDDKIFKLKEEMKILAGEKKELEKVVLEELDKIDEKVIAVSDGKLLKNISKTKSPLKKEHIHKTLLHLTKDEKKTSDIINEMMKSRQEVEKVNLKRIKNKIN